MAVLIDRLLSLGIRDRMSLHVKFYGNDASLAGSEGAEDVLCLCVCVSVCVYVCLCVCLFVCVCMFMCPRLCV